MSELRRAAQAVLDRWDSPAWEWVKQGPTAALMADLRAALAEPVQERKPLTDEEIDKIVAVHVRITDQNLSGAVYMAMRDLEAAHGIGGRDE